MDNYFQCKVLQFGIFFDKMIFLSVDREEITFFLTENLKINNKLFPCAFIARNSTSTLLDGVRLNLMSLFPFDMM